MESQEPRRRLSFRREFDFSRGRRETTPRRYFVFMVVFLAVTLWLIYYFRQAQRSDTAGRRLLDRLFGPRTSATAPAESDSSEDKEATPIQIAP